MILKRVFCAVLLTAALSGCVSRTYVGSAITSVELGASSPRVQRWESVVDGAVSQAALPQLPEYSRRVLSQRIIWDIAPEDIDYRTLRRGRDGSQEVRVDVDCAIREDGLLHACVPTQLPPNFGTPEHVQFFVVVLDSTNLAIRLKASPLDLDGQSSIGQIVRVSSARPTGVVFDQTRVISPRLTGTPTAESMAAGYPLQAEMAGVSADTTVICIMSAVGVPEACSVMFQRLWGGDLIMFDPSSDMGFSAATLGLYARLQGSPLMVDGLPERSLVMGTVRWRP